MNCYRKKARSASEADAIKKHQTNMVADAHAREQLKNEHMRMYVLECAHLMMRRRELEILKLLSIESS